MMYEPRWRASILVQGSMYSIMKGLGLAGGIALLVVTHQIPQTLQVHASCSTSMLMLPGAPQVGHDDVSMSAHHDARSVCVCRVMCAP